MGHGPTTRSRVVGSKPFEDASNKEAMCHSVQPATFSNPLVELPQADDGNSSMSTFLAPRKCQQEEAMKKKAKKEKAAKEKLEKKKVAASARKKVVEESVLPEIAEGSEEGMHAIF